MKYCIFVLANYNHPLLEKCLFHLVKYATPRVDKYILLNNPTEEVLKTAERYKKDFRLHLYSGPNNAGKATDDFIGKNIYDFYFKLDEDVIAVTPDWDKRLLMTYLNYEPEPAFISCMIPNHNYNWTEAVKVMGLEDEFRDIFPYELENYSESALFKKKAGIIKDILQSRIDEYAESGNDAAIAENLAAMTGKVDNSRFYTSPVIYDGRIAEWLWQKVLEKKLKPVKVVKKVEKDYTINLIGYKRTLWKKMVSFGIDDEAEINKYCFSHKLPVIADYSVIAHHYSYRMQYEYMQKKVYPLIKDKLF